MSFSAHRLSFGTGVAATTAATVGRCHVGTEEQVKVGLFRRLADAIRLSRQRQVDREIAAYLAHSGGLITDRIERDMLRQIAATGWCPSRRS